jgi:hypothetical protein
MKAKEKKAMALGTKSVDSTLVSNEAIAQTLPSSLPDDFWCLYNTLKRNVG